MVLLYPLNKIGAFTYTCQLCNSNCKTKNTPRGNGGARKMKGASCTSGQSTPMIRWSDRCNGESNPSRSTWARLSELASADAMRVAMRRVRVLVRRNGPTFSSSPSISGRHQQQRQEALDVAYRCSCRGVGAWD